MEYCNSYIVVANLYLLLVFTIIVNCQFFVDREVDIWLEDLSERVAEEFEVALRSFPLTFPDRKEMRIKDTLNHMIAAVGRVNSVLDHQHPKFTGDTTRLSCVRRNLQKIVRVLEENLEREKQKQKLAYWAEPMSSTLEIVESDLIFKWLKHVDACFDIPRYRKI